MLKNLTIMGRLATGFGLLLALLIACAAVGVFGLNMLYSTAHHAVANDVQIAQHASTIDLLVLNERRFEKDAFINLADAEKLSSYKTKWDTAKAALNDELAAARKLELTADDGKTLDQLGEGFKSYADGFEKTFERIRSGQLKTTQDANAEFGSFKAAVHGMEDASEALNKAALARVSSAADSLAATRTRSSTLQIGIAVLCLLLGAAMCVISTRSITLPLGRAIEIARAVAGGKLDNQIDASGHDETAQVLSALKTMQDALLENELNAKGQISAINKAQAVVEYNLDGSVRVANENFLKLFGYQLDEVQGQHDSLFVDAAGRASADYRALWDKLRRGEFDAGLHKRVAKGGREVFVQATYSPIMDLAGKPYKIVEYAADMTEQVRMKEALDEAVRETRSVVQGAIDGQLTQRIQAAGKSGQIEALSVSVNELLESMMTLVAEIKIAAGEVQSGAQEISKGNLNLSQRTEEGASSLEETASSMEEMTSTVKMTADNAAQARQLAVAARQQAEKGSTVVGSAVAAMSEINQSSRKIADIIGVIDEIAFQTNLLALNAAVEAARAGEQGRGFAVVASEVRNLAGRSATAAKEIKALIMDSVSKVEEGSKLVDQSGKSLDDIGAAVKRVTDVVAEIAEASQEQASGIEQVNKAVMQMDEMTQQNAALVEEASAASEAILGRATHLAQSVAHYVVAAHTAPATARPASAVAPARATPAARPQRLAAAARPAPTRMAPPAPAAVAPKARKVAGGGADDEWDEF
jgi:methyl-accepting chemotaxis protein